MHDWGILRGHIRRRHELTDREAGGRVSTGTALAHLCLRKSGLASLTGYPHLNFLKAGDTDFKKIGPGRRWVQAQQGEQERPDKPCQGRRAPAPPQGWR